MELFKQTYRSYLKLSEAIKAENEDLYYDLMLDQDIKDEWPEIFDLETQVDQIEEAELKPVPKTQKFESVRDYISKFDIREQLKREMSEERQEGRLSEGISQ